MLTDSAGVEWLGAHRFHLSACQFDRVPFVCMLTAVTMNSPLCATNTCDEEGFKPAFWVLTNQCERTGDENGTRPERRVQKVDSMSLVEAV